MLSNEPYGGRLVESIVSQNEVSSGLPEISVNKVIESDLINMATGILSPLTGFMGKKDFLSVCEKNSLASQKLAWTIPVVFDVDQNDIDKIKNSSRVLLRSAESKNPIGIIEPGEVYEHDKKLRINATFGTTDLSHPGVKLVSEAKPFLMAGKVYAFREALDTNPLSYPAGVRAELERRGLKTVAGFQTRNIVHRAHEYLQRIALEVCDGLLIHPIVGWKKVGDFLPEVVKSVYTQFIGDFYPKGKALVTFLNTAMRYAGPKEAVFHAIIRKNFGCTHFVVGRDHAGVGGFYEKYAAHKIFETLPDLGITILKLKGPFYCKKCGMIVTEQTCGHDETAHEEISGTRVRKILSDGRDPEGHFLRQEVLDYLKPYKGSVFYE